jgi:hypothetical protein
MNAVAVCPTGIEAVVKVVLKSAGRVMLDTLNEVLPALEMVIDNCVEEPTSTLLKLKLPLTAIVLILCPALAICAENARNTKISTIRAIEDSFRYSGVVMVFGLFKF